MLDNRSGRCFPVRAGYPDESHIFPRRAVNFRKQGSETFFDIVAQKHGDDDCFDRGFRNDGFRPLKDGFDDEIMAVIVFSLPADKRVAGLQICLLYTSAFL